MERFNPWWLNEPDIRYDEWAGSATKWIPSIVEHIPLKPFALHFLSGPRQVGKTTALRMIIHGLLRQRDPKSIFFYSCDELTDSKELGEVLDNYITSRGPWGVMTSVILLDEITFVKEWWRAVKARVDSGMLARDVLILTGSASLDLLKQKEFFPGRRGRGRDFILQPLEFPSYVMVRTGLDLRSGGVSEIDKNLKANRLYSDRLAVLMTEYMQIGGFPRGILDFVKYRKVTQETARAYLDWMKGDWGRAGRNDRYMKEVISYLFLARGTPVSWHSIASHTAVSSPHTARTYIETLEGIFAAIELDFLTPQGKVDFKKNRKVHFTDPFIFKVLAEYTNSEISEDWKLEATVASHLSRLGPVHHWRNRSEVDAVCVRNGRQTGFEVTTGVKTWRPPWHIKKAHLVDRNNAHLYLSAIGANPVSLA